MKGRCNLTIPAIFTRQQNLHQQAQSGLCQVNPGIVWHALWEGKPGILKLPPGRPFSRQNLYCYFQTAFQRGFAFANYFLVLPPAWIVTPGAQRISLRSREARGPLPHTPWMRAVFLIDLGPSHPPDLPAGGRLVIISHKAPHPDPIKRLHFILPGRTTPR